MSEWQMILIAFVVFAVIAALIPLVHYGHRRVGEWWRSSWYIYVTVLLMWLGALLWAKELMR